MRPWHRMATIALVGALVAGLPAVRVVAQETAGVTLEASRRAIDFGRSVRLSGKISPPSSGETIVIFDGAGKERATTTTDETGSYRVTLSPRRTTRFQARWLAMVSQPVEVKVRPKVAVDVGGVRLFGKARVTGVVRPLQSDGRSVSVRLFRGDRRLWQREVPLRDGRRFATRFHVRKPGTYRIKASFSDAAGVRGSGGTPKMTPPLPSLAPGSRGIVVELLEKRLRQLGYHLDGTDRSYNSHAADALRAFNKIEGRARLGTVDRGTWLALADARRPKARHRTDGFHIEVDQTRQVLMTVRDGRVERVIHVSTGRDGYTPDGTWKVYRKIAGYSGGRLYYPSYYEGRRALHGWPEVPTYNASHGCTRLPMWTAKWVYRQATMGTTIHIYH